MGVAETDSPEPLSTAGGHDVGTAGPSPGDAGTGPASAAGRRPAEAGSAVAVEVSTGAGVDVCGGAPEGDVHEATRARQMTPRTACPALRGRRCWKDMATRCRRR